MSRRLTFPALLLLAAFVASCKVSDPFSDDDRVATSIVTVMDTYGQSAIAGTALPQPIAVQVLDQLGVPMANEAVGWTVVNGGGSLKAAATVTDENGTTTNQWTLGRILGEQRVQAAIVGGATDTVMANAIVGAASSFVLVDGDRQRIPTGTTSAAIRVKVLDRTNNPVPYEKVTWTASSGTLSQNESVTDGYGIASVTITAGSGMQTVRAQLQSGATLVFTVTGIDQVAGLTASPPPR